MFKKEEDLLMHVNNEINLMMLDDEYIERIYFDES